MGDYIERQAALDAVNEFFHDPKVDIAFNAVPAANVREDVRGEWEIVTGSNGKEYMVCTNCRVTQNLTALFTFCPNCGARMDGGNSND